MENATTKNWENASEKNWEDTAASAKHKLEEKYQNVKQKSAEALQKGEETVKKTISDVDRRLHENPWPYLAGVAVSALLLGFIMGGKRDY